MKPKTEESNGKNRTRIYDFRSGPKLLRPFMVPEALHYKSFRDSISRSEWQKKSNEVRKIGKCDICGRDDKLETHEQYIYETTDGKHAVQRLTDFLCVCQKCHQVIHFYRSRMLGLFLECHMHYSKVMDDDLLTYVEKVAAPAFDEYNDYE
jgi:hypothetical protein